MNSYYEQVQTVVEQKPTNRILVANRLKREELPDIPETTYYKCLERMTKSGDLVHLTKGLYYRPEVKDGSIVPISEEQIIDYYINDSAGVIVGERLYNNLGLTNRLCNNTLIYSNVLQESKKHIGNIEIQRIDMQIDDTITATIETFDILQNYNKIQDIDKHRFMTYMRAFSERYSDNVTNQLIECKKYKKSTIAFMERILSYYGISNSLKNHLSPLSDYKIPTLCDMKPDVPENIAVSLQEYVSQLKELYRKDLKSVILFGSYARGDYHEDSDIDIFILLSSKVVNEGNYRCGISDVTYDFNSKYELDVNPVVNDEATYHKWLDAYPFYQNIAREGVVLYGAA